MSLATPEVIRCCVEQFRSVSCLGRYVVALGCSRQPAEEVAKQPAEAMTKPARRPSNQTGGRRRGRQGIEARRHALPGRARRARALQPDDRGDAEGQVAFLRQPLHD